MTLDDLKIHGLIYLATPYTRYNQGPEIAFRHAARLLCKLTMAGLPVYSPIVHGHPMTRYGVVVPATHDRWMQINRPMMEKSDALLIATMDGWDESIGIADETSFFRALPASVYYIDPDSLALL